MASKQWLVSFEPRKMSFRWNWRVPKWRFSRFSHFGEKSAILRKPHLELFLASNRALNAENVLFTPQMSSKTSVRAFRSDRSKSKNFRKIKVPTHALRPKSGQIWELLKNRFGQNSARKIAFELKIILGCGIRLFWRHVKFGSIWTRSKNFDFRRPPQKGTFRRKSSVRPSSHMCVRETSKMLFLVGR